MLLAETNKIKRLLHLTFVGQVGAEELREHREELALLLGELPDGFRLLTDLTHLESMELACEAELARLMDQCDQRKPSLVVLEIPDPRKDIGLNILAMFHYQRAVKGVTCKSLQEALGLLD